MLPFGLQASGRVAAALLCRARLVRLSTLERFYDLFNGVNLDAL